MENGVVVEQVEVHVHMSSLYMMEVVLVGGGGKWNMWSGWGE